jgi:hypothetical protein
MNRRNFFRTAALAAAAVFIPPMGPGSPKLLAKRRGPIPVFVRACNTWTKNPEWVTATYELSFVLMEDDGAGGWHRVRDPYPPRFHCAADAEFYLSKIV